MINAIERGNYKLVQRIINKGNDVNRRYVFKDNRENIYLYPLLFALEEKQNDIARLLVESGANVNIRDEPQKTTPLMKAVDNEDVVMVKYLLEKGAHADIAFFRDNSIDEHVLCNAVYIKDDAIFRLLLEHGANPNLVDEHTNSILMRCVERSSISKVRLLLKHKCHVNYRNCKGETAFQLASWKNNISTLLLEHGADIHIKDYRMFRRQDKFTKRYETTILLCSIFHQDIVCTLLPYIY